MKPVTLITRTALGNTVELTIKRWFQTREFWVNSAGWAVTVLPTALTLINAVGLTPIALLVWSLTIQSVLFAANQYLKNTSRSVVVNKAELQDAHEAIGRGELGDQTIVPPDASGGG